MIKHEPEISQDVRMQADWMIQEMIENKLVVILVDAPEPMFTGHKIRVAESKNPEWYRNQGLNRKESLISLNRIRFGLPLSNMTDYKILDIVQNELNRNYENQ